MRKIIAAFNMTLDGFCEHTAGIADDEIHEHYTDLLSNADSILYGRITYHLMEYWLPVLKNPTGNKSIDDFAVAIDKIPKIVFSRTLTDREQIVNGWESARLAKRDLKEEVLALKESGDDGSKDVLVGSRSLIISLMNLNLIDEFQLCVQPIILGNGVTPLLKDINKRIDLKLIKTKTFSCGAIILYYGFHSITTISTRINT